MRSTIGARSRKKSLFLVGDRGLLRAPLAPRIAHFREVDARDLADARLQRLLCVAQTVEQGKHILVVAARDLLVCRCDLREHRHGQQSRRERCRKQDRGFQSRPPQITRHATPPVCGSSGYQERIELVAAIGFEGLTPTRFRSLCEVSVLKSSLRRLEIPRQR